MQSFTDKCLLDALIILTEHKDLKKITITELIKKAGVSRSTFYRKYTSIEDMIIKYFESMNFGFFFPENIEDFDLEKHMRQYLNFLFQNKNYFKIMIKAKLEFLMFNTIEYYAKGPFRPYLYKMGFKHKYEVSAFTGLFYMMSFDWIKDDCQDLEGSLQVAYNLVKRCNPDNEKDAKNDMLI